MRRYFPIINVIFFVALSLKSFGQIDTGKKEIDTAKVQEREANVLSKEIEQAGLMRLADSIRKATLLIELQSLTSGDFLKRQELMQKIREIETRDSIRTDAKVKAIEKLKMVAVGYPVIPFTDTLFYIYTKIGPFGAKERADLISKKIDEIYEEGLFSPDSLVIVDSEESFDIMYKGSIILSINELEALWNEKDKKQLAEEYRDKISAEIIDELDQYSLINTLIRIAEVLVVLIIIWLLLKLLNRLFLRSTKYFEDHKDRFVKPVKIRTYELIGSDKMLGVVLWFNNAIKIFLFFLLVYISLPIIFSIFPYTKGWATVLIGWVLTPVKSIIKAVGAYLPNLFTIIVIFIVVRYVVKLFHFLSREIQRGKLVLAGFEREWAMPTFNIIRFLLYAFMFIVIFPYLPGSKSPVFQGVSVFLGVLFSLGSTSTIGNITSGLVMTYMRPFGKGDRIKVGEVIGDVIGRTLLVTRIRTIKNEEITIPNSLMLSGHVTNYSSYKKDDGLIVHSTVTIGYDVPWKNMHKALLDAALATEFIEQEPAPFVLQTSLDDFYVSYQINAYTKEPNKQAVIYSNLHQNIQDKCNEYGIEILSPHYRAMRDGNMTTIPANYLPSDYKAPGFNVQVNKEGEN